jgi:hypothetical protein
MEVFHPAPGSTWSPNCIKRTNAVVRLRNSWWWAEGLPETCRVVIPIIKLELGASVGFIHKKSSAICYNGGAMFMALSMHCNATQVNKNFKLCIYLLDFQPRTSLFTFQVSPLTIYIKVTTLWNGYDSNIKILRIFKTKCVSFEYNKNTNKCTIVSWCSLITGYPAKCFRHLCGHLQGGIRIPLQWQKCHNNSTTENNQSIN